MAQAALNSYLQASLSLVQCKSGETQMPMYYMCGTWSGARQQRVQHEFQQ